MAARSNGALSSMGMQVVCSDWRKAGRSGSMVKDVKEEVDMSEEEPKHKRPKRA